MEEIQAVTNPLIENIEHVIIGKREVIELIIVGLLSQGHVLIEDVPGVGKTMLARALAKSLGCTFRRIQFTPDMLPSDVTGVSIFNQKTREFEFRPGPIMAQIVLTDEINRATPKTQAALLEAMQELQVTVDGVTHPLPRPFLVLATQNPIEYEGTFPLPEAQLDRFLMRIRLGYPDPDDEIAILDSQQYVHPLTQIGQVVDVEELTTAQEKLKDVYVDPLIKRYIVEIVTQTRRHPDIYLGSSPRGSLALYRTGQARAAMLGRDYVIPDDIKALATPTLAHRLIISPSARLKDVTGEAVMREILATVPVPGAHVRPT
ncbi:MAG: AAA family ATPase [Chloroflexi bacterium]|nr:MAG: AAA family ATPase [Chloroflexota bacterium]RLC91606.1 MAG: AAA family ATPase [Chloroflexota bacterium]HEY67105.1 MoxR family ATPase [Thermoflexia bacterium]